MFKPNYFLKIRRVGGRGPRRQWGWEWDSVVTNGRVRVPRATGPASDGSDGRRVRRARSKTHTLTRPYPSPVQPVRPFPKFERAGKGGRRARVRRAGQGSDGFCHNSILSPLKLKVHINYLKLRLIIYYLKSLLEEIIISALSNE